MHIYLGQTSPIVVRWSTHGHQIWVYIFRRSVHWDQIYPPQLSDEVNKMKCTWTSDMSSYFQMRCTLRSDIPPTVVRWSEQDEVHMDIRYEFIFSDEVHIEIRYTPQLSDEVNKIKWTQTSDMSSYFQMKCTLRPVIYATPLHPSSNQAYISATPLHPISFTYSKMHIYPWQTDPTPPPIKHRCMQNHYTQ